MSTMFGDEYTDVYDRMYAAKDYGLECDLIERVVPVTDQGPALLDMGCGTGNHALTLARRGYSVTGVDQSAAMVRTARQKSSLEQLAVEWHVGDITDAHVNGSFDAVIIMFAVLGYLTETERLIACLRNARRHLGPHGKLIFDVWYGAAVLVDRPVDRAKVFEQDDGYVIRAVRPELHAERDVVDVHTRLWRVVEDQVTFDCTEVHSVRYFFIPELEHLLAECSFRADAFFSFPNLDSPPSVETWSLGCVASVV